MKNLIYMLIIILVSCGTDHSDIWENFARSPKPAKQLNGAAQISLTVLDTGRKSHNRYYRQLYNYGPQINKFLFEKAYSTKPSSYFQSDDIVLTEGDLAITLLIDINNIDNNTFDHLVPAAILTDYNKAGIKVWWEWIHMANVNRMWLISRLKKLLI